MTLRTYATDYQVSDGDGFTCVITAKDQPERERFMVTKIYGDVTRPDALKAAILRLLGEHGAGPRTIWIML